MISNTKSETYLIKSSLVEICETLGYIHDRSFMQYEGHLNINSIAPEYDPIGHDTVKISGLYKCLSKRYEHNNSTKQSALKDHVATRQRGNTSLVSIFRDQRRFEREHRIDSHSIILRYRDCLIGDRVHC